MSKQTILITGASTGIGRATAKYFHAQGWNVGATMRSPEKVEALEEAEGLKLYKLDVQSKQQIDQAVTDVLADFGRIDVLLNNAGYGAAGPLEAATEEQIRHQFEVNFFGMVNMVRACLPQMRKQNSGTIVNISSVGGRLTLPFFSLYHGTKWAMEGFTESLVFELRPFNIRLKIVEPGGVRTDFSSRSLVMFDLKDHPEYAPAVMRFTQNFGEDAGRQDGYSSPEQMAEIIFGAATDGSEQLRYLAGEDAKAMVAQREEVGTEAFLNGMYQNMLG